MHMTVFVHIPDPLVGLTLRINDQRPPPAVKYEYTVVSTQGISGKTILLPISDLHLSRQDTG